MVHCHDFTRLASISAVTTATAFTLLRPHTSTNNDKVTTEDQGKVTFSQLRSNSVGNLNCYSNSHMFHYGVTSCEEVPRTGTKVYAAYQQQQGDKGTTEFS